MTDFIQRRQFEMSKFSEQIYQLEYDFPPHSIWLTDFLNHYIYFISRFLVYNGRQSAFS